MDDMRISQFYGLNKLIDYIKFRAWSRFIVELRNALVTTYILL